MLIAVKCAKIKYNHSFSRKQGNYILILNNVIAIRMVCTLGINRR